jgi:hypothetical protein
MTVRRLLAAFAVLVVVPVISGCGAAAGAGSDPASLAPAGARAVADIDGNLDSTQWRAARDLIGRFPDGDKLIDKLREADGAAGDQIVFVVMKGDSDAVVLTQPDDTAKLRSLVAEYHLVSREVNGWTAVTDKAETLNAYQHALEGGTLEGDKSYEAAKSKFPDDALATLYARGSDQGDWTGLALTAEDGGFRLAGRAATGSATAETLDPALLDAIPADALAAFAFGGGEVSPDLQKKLYGLPSTLVGAFSGGAVVWVRPGMPIPELTAIVPKANIEIVEQILSEAMGYDFTEVAEDTELDGHPAKRIPLSTGGIALTYAEIDGRFVVTTGTTLGGGGRLVDDPSFKDARGEAGATENLGGFVYVDVERVSTLLSLLGGLGEGAVPPELTRNLEHVKSLYAAYGGEGSEHEISVFVAIR